MRFQVARDLGMTVAELGDRMSARELVWWQALYVVEAEEREAQARKSRGR